MTVELDLFEEMRAFAAAHSSVAPENREDGDCNARTRSVWRGRLAEISGASPI
jgi:hypothetical protein